MNGLELSEKYFFEFGLPIFENEFDDIIPFLAAGLVGSGSECFGFDDYTSTDHDFEPSFCIFIPDDDTLVSRKSEFELERAYKKLPDGFMGFNRQKVAPSGGIRRGVIRTGNFYRLKTGSPDGLLSLETWCRLPEFYLAEAVNGKVFFDNYGEFTTIRNRLLNMPNDVVLKKLAGNLISAAQCGNYNYLRCISHNETAAAQLTLYEFEKSAVNALFLLNGTYQPYFKWKYRALRSIPNFNDTANDLEYLISTPNDYGNIDKKLEIINKTSELLCALCSEHFSVSSSLGLEKTAFELNDKIEDITLRNENILYCV